MMETILKPVFVADKTRL